MKNLLSELSDGRTCFHFCIKEPIITKVNQHQSLANPFSPYNNRAFKDHMSAQASRFMQSRLRLDKGHRRYRGYWELSLWETLAQSHSCIALLCTYRDNVNAIEKISGHVAEATVALKRGEVEWLTEGSLRSWNYHDREAQILNFVLQSAPLLASMVSQTNEEV